MKKGNLPISGTSGKNKREQNLSWNKYVIKPLAQRITATVINSTILLTIPDSNVAGERVFFMIAKSNTKRRSSLDHNHSLNSIILIFPNFYSIITVFLDYWKLPKDLLVK